MSAFVVRLADVDDAGGIARVHVESWRETYARLVEPGELDVLSVERRADRWRTMLSDGTVAWVADDARGTFGFASVVADDSPEAPRPLVLACIYVLADRLGSGAGQALLDAALGDAPASLFVAEDNPRAIRFYERNGFTLDGRSEEHLMVRTAIRSVRMVR